MKSVVKKVFYVDVVCFILFCSNSMKTVMIFLTLFLVFATSTNAANLCEDSCFSKVS